MSFPLSAVFRRWRTIIVVSVLTTTAVCFAAWQLSTIAFADAAPQPVPPAQDAAFLLDCSQNAVSQPVTFSLLCGNGTYALDNLRWEEWGTGAAHATGTYFEKDCTPNCAQGMLQGYPVRVDADEIQHTGAVARYERLTLHFEGARPEWLQDGDSVSYDLGNSDRTEVRNAPAQ